jgi:SET domain-containing protein
MAVPNLDPGRRRRAQPRYVPAVADVSVWRSPKVEIRPSPVSGEGLFAREPIAAGEVVAVKAGHVVDTEEVARLTEEIGDFSLQVHDDLFLTPRHSDEVDDLVVRINHSCDANIGFEGVCYVAMREIAADEELCHDYALARSAPYSMSCHCGAEDCRGTVTGEDWRLPAVQEKYGHYFMPHILRRIRNLQDRDRER